MKLLIVLAAVLVGSLAYPSKEQLHAQWNTFKATHQKSYNTIEEFRRINIFKENVRKIEEHNKLYEKGQSSYKMGINQFADMTRSEFLKYLTRHKKNPMTQVNTIKYQRHYLELPEKVDWRNEGAVTGVKNQAQCGSCWAFSTTGSLEGQNFLKNGVLVSLSEQELVDCSHEHHNSGCDGGLMESGFEYVIKHGLSTEDEYPYEATDGRCRRGSLPSAVRATNYVVITPGDEEELKEAVATVGPIAVAIDASGWQFYESGILEDPDCSPDNLNHGVLGVGYGTENGQDYWLVKNSWGLDWGENGYIRTARNANNNCGVASDSSYPIL